MSMATPARTAVHVPAPVTASVGGSGGTVVLGGGTWVLGGGTWVMEVLDVSTTIVVVVTGTVVVSGTVVVP